MFTNKNRDQTLRQRIPITTCGIQIWSLKTIMPCFKQLAAGLSQEKPGWRFLFSRTRVQSQLSSVGFAVDKVLLGEGFLGVLQFYCHYHSTNVPHPFI
jgi:hypothetical protein